MTYKPQYPVHLLHLNYRCLTTKIVSQSQGDFFDDITRFPWQQSSGVIMVTWYKYNMYRDLKYLI